MAYVPYQSVFRGVVAVVQGDGQLNHTQTCAEVAAGLTNAVKQKFPQFTRKLGQLAFGQLAQIRRSIHPIEQWRGWAAERNFVKHTGDGSGKTAIL
ncbi:MAG: hypothetical protein AseanaTS_22480 [Candidatus Pelagadaptatus aseana]